MTFVILISAFAVIGVIAVILDIYNSLNIRACNIKGGFIIIPVKDKHCTCDEDALYRYFKRRRIDNVFLCGDESASNRVKTKKELLEYIMRL